MEREREASNICRSCMHVIMPTDLHEPWHFMTKLFQLKCTVFFCFPSDSIGTLISLSFDPRLSHSHFGCTKPLDCNHRSYRYLEVALVLFTFETNRSILLVYVDSLWLLPDPPEKISSSYFVETSTFFEVYEDPFDHQCAHQTEICHPLLPCSGNNI